MAIENAGPGGVTNSYGVRTAVRSDIVENGQNALEIKAVKDTSGSLTSLVGDDGQVASVVKFDPATNQPYVLNAAGQAVPLVGNRAAVILDSASAGASTAWLPISPNPERLMYQLDSGTTSTQFAVDISADGSTSLGQAFTGVWSRSDLAEITPPIMFSNPLAKFFRVTIVSGGPITVARGA